MKYYDSDKVFLEIRNYNDINKNEKQLLALSELENIAPIEVWTAYGTNQQLAYSTHGIFRYFGKFPPPIATHLIRNYTSESETVFDPMCGSGTSGVEALLNNRKSILNDVNPLSLLLSKVKTTYLPEDVLQKTAEKIYSNYKPLNITEYQFEPNYLKNYKHWFLEKTTDSLRGLKYIIEKIDNSDVRDFFNVCFAATVRRVSRATTQQGRLFLDVNTAEEDALPFFKKKVEKAISGVSTLPKEKSSTKIISHDLRDALPYNLHEKSDLVICHPPYFNSYKYSSINSLELAWLDVDYSQVRKNEVREFFKVGKEEKVYDYIRDMVNVLINLHVSLKDESRLALMIGDTIMHDNYICVTKQILDKIQDYYHVELIALRAPKYTEAAWVASQRRHSNKVGIALYDYIIVMRKR